MTDQEERITKLARDAAAKYIAPFYGTDEHLHAFRPHAVFAFNELRKRQERELASLITDTLDKYAEGLKEIIERIMTQHWDLDCCMCWFCVEGRRLGCRPRENYLHDKTKGQVDVEAT